MISSRLIARDSLLFVYGTLRPFVDAPMARWLQRVARYVGPATLRGRLYDRGLYPCLRSVDRSRDQVSGDVYRVTTRRAWRVLDRHEAQFVRERCTVKLARGVRASAWTYRYRFSVSRLPRIVSGDYRSHVARAG